MKHAAAIAGLFLTLAFGGSPAAHAQNPPALPPVPKPCEAVGVQVTSSTSPLPNVAAALKDRKKITILAIGSTSGSLRGPASAGNYGIVEKYLEDNFKGLDVSIVHRGVSGELATDASGRIKNEVALTSADLVLWQLGTADAMAQVPVADFYVAVKDTLGWLRERKVDVILVGLRYARTMAGDLHYQAMRTAIREVAKEQNVIRISRYEAEETLQKIKQGPDGATASDTADGEAAYACMAEYLARAIAAALFVRDAPAKR